jgi:predicted O-linked N-acetylglucosamine transferase (SPINDLY family)
VFLDTIPTRPALRNAAAQAGAGAFAARALSPRLAANRATHPLFDMARFAHVLDDLLQAAWENRSSPMPSSIAS